MNPDSQEHVPETANAHGGETEDPSTEPAPPAEPDPSVSPEPSPFPQPDLDVIEKDLDPGGTEQR